MSPAAPHKPPAPERWRVLHRVEDALEVPMLVLALAWLVLLVVELVRGLTPLLETAGTVIWAVFVLEFAFRLLLAPDKPAYLRANWLTLVSLLVPALRLLRLTRIAVLLRAARAARGLRLVKVVAGINRGMRALRGAMGRRGFGYVTALTALVVLAGAAGMYAFENENPDGRGLHGYAEALWWTSMLMTTLGSEYWPQTVEGRVLCFLLALYALAVFGYITATIASFFIGRDAADERGELAGERSIAALREEVRALRDEIRRLGERTGRREAPPPP